MPICIEIGSFFFSDVHKYSNRQMDKPTDERTRAIFVTKTKTKIKIITIRLTRTRTFKLKKNLN